MTIGSYHNLHLQTGVCGHGYPTAIISTLKLVCVCAHVTLPGGVTTISTLNGVCECLEEPQPQSHLETCVFAQVNAWRWLILTYKALKTCCCFIYTFYAVPNHGYIYCSVLHFITVHGYTNTNFRFIFLLTRFQEDVYEDLPVQSIKFEIYHHFSGLCFISGSQYLAPAKNCRLLRFIHTNQRVW